MTSDDRALRLPRRLWLRAAAAAGSGALGALVPDVVGAADRGGVFRFGHLAWPGLPDPRPTALRRLAWELVRRTSLVTGSDTVDLHIADPNLFHSPFLVLAGDRGFALPSEADVARLRRWVTFGGFLLIDSAEGRAGGAFDQSVRKLLAALFPGELPTRIAPDHVLWKSFYVLSSPSGRILASPYLEGLERDRRLSIVYSQNDLLGAWARDGFGRWEHEVVPGGEEQREMAFRLGVNLAMYALCLDYKNEQAHIDYILRTRRLPR
jgi:hypothetical protein